MMRPTRSSCLLSFNEIGPGVGTGRGHEIWYTLYKKNSVEIRISLCWKIINKEFGNLSVFVLSFLIFLLLSFSLSLSVFITSSIFNRFSSNFQDMMRPTRSSCLLSFNEIGPGVGTGRGHEIWYTLYKKNSVEIRISLCWKIINKEFGNLSVFVLSFLIFLLLSFSLSLSVFITSSIFNRFSSNFQDMMRPTRSSCLLSFNEIGPGVGTGRGHEIWYTLYKKNSVEIRISLCWKIINKE